MKAGVFGTILAGALAGMLGGKVLANEHHGTDKPTKDKKSAGHCQNHSCRGKSACHGHGNSACRGQNTCKGHGWLEAKDAKDCAAKKGKWVAASEKK